MDDKFQLIKEGINQISQVRIAWEFRDADKWQIELEEKSSAQRFSVRGTNAEEADVVSLLKHVVQQAHSLRKKHKEGGGYGFNRDSGSGRRFVSSYRPRSGGYSGTVGFVSGGHFAEPEAAPVNPQPVDPEAVAPAVAVAPQDQAVPVAPVPPEANSGPADDDGHPALERFIASLGDDDWVPMDQQLDDDMGNNG